MIALPKEFKFSHQYALFLHDLIAEIVVHGEALELFNNVQITFKNKRQAEEFEKLNLQGDALCDWMDQNGYTAELCTLHYKQLIIATLADLCHFVYEAMSCAKRGKLTVAYALLRKPLKQNLFLLECLLAQPGEFVVGFHKKEITELIKEFEKLKKEIIAATREKLEYKMAFNTEFVWELRYSPKAKYGFDIYWDKALHLVTEWKLKRTENSNLNFIFSDNSARHSQWTHFYNTLPFLLFYTLEVAEALLGTLVETKNQTEFSLQKVAGFCLWTMRSSEESKEAKDKTIKAMFGDMGPCPICNKEIYFTEKILKRAYKVAELICPHCEMVILPIEKARKNLLKFKNTKINNPKADQIE